MKLLTFTSIWLCLALQTLHSQPAYGITAFGTRTFSADSIRKTFGTDLEVIIELYENNRGDHRQPIAKLNDKINTKNQFAHVNVRVFKSYSGNIDVIVDFVEKQDSMRRMNFRKIEGKTYSDPDSLIAKWTAYETVSGDLFQKGEIHNMDCPVVHCTWAFNHPRLQPFLDTFQKSVPLNRETLIAILGNSDSTNFRANAAFLLAHAGLPSQQLADILMTAVNDPSSHVRNNCLRVIYYIVRNETGIIIDLDRVISVLDFPTFTDRNKALVVLRSLPLDDLTEEQLARIIPILVEVMEKGDAHNYRNAHLVMQKISKKRFAIDDIVNWKSWADSLVSVLDKNDGR